MSIVDFFHVDVSKQTKPTFRTVPADSPPAPRPQPAQPQPAPQDLATAEAALQALQAASTIVRDKFRDNPDVPRGAEIFSDTAARNWRARWAEDVRTALAEAAEGKPLSILDAELWRAKCALDGADLDGTGAIGAQQKIVAVLRENQLRAEYADAAVELGKMDGEIVRLLLSLRDKWEIRTAKGEAIRRPRFIPAHPVVRTVGDQLLSVMRSLRGRTAEDLL